MGEKHGGAVGRTRQGRRWLAGGRDGSCTWILGPRPLIKVCMTTLRSSFCLHQAMGRAVATGAAPTEITGSAQGSGPSETLSPLMGGNRASRTPLPATLALQCPGRPRLPKRCRQGIMAPPRRESELCQGERGRTPGQGWAGGPEGQAPAGPEPGALPSGASSWLLPPGARAANFRHNTSHAGRCCGLTRQRGLGRRALVHKHLLVLPVSGGHKLVPLPRRGALPGRRPGAKVRAAEGDSRSPSPPTGPAPCVCRLPTHLDRRRSLGASFLLPEIPLAHVSGHNILGAEGSRVAAGPRWGSWEPRARHPPASQVQGRRAGPRAPLRGAPTEEARKPRPQPSPGTRPATTGPAARSSARTARARCAEGARLRARMDAYLAGGGLGGRLSLHLSRLPAALSARHSHAGQLDGGLAGELGGPACDLQRRQDHPRSARAWGWRSRA